MWIYEKKLQYPVKIDNPNPRLAGMIITALGGPDGELAAATRYLNQRYNMPDGRVVGVLTDVDTIIGKPIITASGYQIIPFSKVTLGSLAGGGEYGDEKLVRETETFPFAGGNGTVVSMKPMGFIIDDGKTCSILRVTDDPVDNLVERASEILRNITAKE